MYASHAKNMSANLQRIVSKRIVSEFCRRMQRIQRILLEANLQQNVSEFLNTTDLCGATLERAATDIRPLKYDSHYLHGFYLHSFVYTVLFTRF